MRNFAYFLFSKWYLNVINELLIDEYTSKMHHDDVHVKKKM